MHNAFAILGVRLAQIESPETFREVYSFVDYQDLFLQVEQAANNFDFKETCLFIDFYIDRVSKIINWLSESLPSSAMKIKRPVKLVTNETDKDDSKKNKIPDDLFLLEEVEYYLKRLQFMSDTRKEFRDRFIEIKLPDIVLPENFSIKELKEHFAPTLSTSQAGKLLKYFKRRGLIPRYSAEQLGILGQYFFGWNRDEVRKAATSGTDDLNDLEILKNQLDKVIQLINEDIRTERISYRNSSRGKL